MRRVESGIETDKIEAAPAL